MGVNVGECALCVWPDPAEDCAEFVDMKGNAGVGEPAPPPLVRIAEELERSRNNGRSEPPRACAGRPGPNGDILC